MSLVCFLAVFPRTHTRGVGFSSGWRTRRDEMAGGRRGRRRDGGRPVARARGAVRVGVARSPKRERERESSFGVWRLRRESAPFDVESVAVCVRLSLSLSLFTLSLANAHANARAPLERKNVAEKRRVRAKKRWCARCLRAVC